MLGSLEGGCDANICANRDLNRLVMDYLVMEGYKSAAGEFSVEARLTPCIEFESIENRMHIREALQRGDVDDAITRVNDLDPEVSMASDEVPKGFNLSCTTLKSPGIFDDNLKPKLQSSI